VISETYEREAIAALFVLSRSGINDDDTATASLVTLNMGEWNKERGENTTMMNGLPNRKKKRHRRQYSRETRWLYTKNVQTPASSSQCLLGANARGFAPTKSHASRNLKNIHKEVLRSSGRSTPVSLLSSGKKQRRKLTVFLSPPPKNPYISDSIRLASHISPLSSSHHHNDSKDGCSSRIVADAPATSLLKRETKTRRAGEKKRQNFDCAIGYITSHICTRKMREIGYSNSVLVSLKSRKPQYARKVVLGSVSWRCNALVNNSKKYSLAAIFAFGEEDDKLELLIPDTRIPVSILQLELKFKKVLRDICPNLPVKKFKIQINTDSCIARNAVV